MKANYDAKWVEAAERLQKTMKGWRDGHPTATFLEIEDALESELAKLRAEMLSDMAGAMAQPLERAARPRTGHLRSGRGINRGRGAPPRRPCGPFEGLGVPVMCPACGKRTWQHGHRKRELTAAGDGPAPRRAARPQRATFNRWC